MAVTDTEKPVISIINFIPDYDFSANNLGHLV